MVKLPKFAAPPVVEVVLSVQFAPIPTLSAAHVGWYWKDHLGVGDWNRAEETFPLEDTFERFGNDEEWISPGAIRFRKAPPSSRIQLINTDDERMIQIQRSRFIYNWRKRTGVYPTFDQLLPEFEGRFEEFSTFIRNIGLGDPAPNQWEVVYVNHIFRGSLWSSPGDWRLIAPSFSAPADVPNQTPDTFRYEWSFLIGGSLGRLHISAQRGRAVIDDTDTILLQLTARGPIEEKGDFRNGFSLGHEQIVRTFAAMTTESAHKNWKRSQ